MAKIDFEDGSSVELKDVDGEYVLILRAKDYDNPLKKIVSTCSLKRDELKKLVDGVGFKQ